MMTSKQQFKGVEDTLYIPLAARIYASERFPSFFVDEKAVALKDAVAHKKLNFTSSEYFHMASVCRQYCMDQQMKAFLGSHTSANIVLLGAGLETAYHRLANHEAHFYQVDLPEVMQVRRMLLGAGANETLIAGDMFTLEWLTAVDSSLPTLVVVAGVFQYFSDHKIIAFIKALKEQLPRGEIIFDATNHAGLKMANRYVRRTGNKDAEMLFCIDDVQQFAALTETRIVSVEGFFEDALRKCKKLKWITKLYMYMADKLRRTQIVHLAFQ